MYGEIHLKMDVKTIGWDIAEPTGKPSIEWCYNAWSVWTCKQYVR